MSENGPGAHGRSGPEDELARVYREFAEGLQGRLDRIRTSLGALRRGWSAEAAQELRRETHSLKGTAASFGAEAIAEVAAELTALTAGWLEVGRVSRAELPAADRGVARLAERIERYRARTGEEGA